MQKINKYIQPTKNTEKLKKKHKKAYNMNNQSNSQQTTGGTIQLSPYELVHNTTLLCHDISSIIETENNSLRNKEMDNIEETLKKKRHLVAKMEASLREVKLQREQIKISQDATSELQHLEVAIQDYKVKARKNILLLKVAYDATNNFLGMVRQAVEITRPKVHTYGNTGQMNSNHKQTSLVNKSI